MSRAVRGAFAILLSLCFLSSVKALDTSASSAILMDAESGRVLYEQNARERRYIASITKLMTALVAAESGHRLDETVTVLPEYVGAEGSSMYLEAGEKLMLNTLLYGLLLSSGNDAALAVADVCGGSVERFVDMMNRRAVLLGMDDTTFKNPSGLTEEGHQSTAADMAKLAAACMRNETVAAIVATRSVTLEGRTFTNHNKLLWRYEGCIGMKTGYTERSGRTLISCARREGMTLIAVTLNDRNDWVDHTAMLDYGFKTYTRTQLTAAGEPIATLPVKGSLLPFVGVQAGDDTFYPLAKGENLRREVTLIRPVAAPVRRGQTAGVVTFYAGDRAVIDCPLVYDRAAGFDLVRRGRLRRLLGI